MRNISDSLSLDMSQFDIDEEGNMQGDTNKGNVNFKIQDNKSYFEIDEQDDESIYYYYYYFQVEDYQLNRSYNSSKTVNGDLFWSNRKENINFTANTKPELDSQEYNQQVFATLIGMERYIDAQILEILKDKFLAFTLDKETNIFWLKDDFKSTMIDSLFVYFDQELPKEVEIIVENFGVKINNDLQIIGLYTELETSYTSTPERYSQIQKGIFSLDWEYNNSVDLQSPQTYIPFQKLSIFQDNEVVNTIENGYMRWTTTDIYDYQQQEQENQFENLIEYSTTNDFSNADKIYFAYYDYDYFNDDIQSVTISNYKYDNNGNITGIETDLLIEF